jgi:hypothetical protein
MDLQYVPRELKKLDQVIAEVLLAPVMQDERPPQGVAGMVDWRLSGQISRLIKTGFFSGAPGETLLVPTKPALPFDKTVLIGCGPKAEFDERAFLGVLAHFINILKGLKAGHAVVELPGRHLDAIAADRAIDLLLEQPLPVNTKWTLVDGAEGQKVLSERRLRERRHIAP